MIISVLKLNVNSFPIQGMVSAVITDRYPTVSWTCNLIDRVETTPPNNISSITKATPSGYEIRIGTENIDIGTNSFTGDVIFTDLVSTQETSWRYTGPKLQRGHTYYGQLRIVDNFSNISAWKVFTFIFNSLS